MNELIHKLNHNEITPLQFIFAFIETANLKDLQSILFHVGARLFKVRKGYSGMARSNLEEAANFVTDATKDIGAAINAEDETPCNCYKCDNCVAARSDEHYDRKAGN